jgi:hypothetical protein
MSLVRKRTTEAMEAANRSNSLKCTGPITEAGKISARMNALKHGLTGKGPAYVHEVLGEKHEDRIALRIGIIRDLGPQNALEAELARQIVENRWRWHRVRRAEEGLLAARRMQFDLDYARKLAADGRSAASVGEAKAATDAGLASLPDSDTKFTFILQCLQAARQAVQMEGFGEQAWKRIKAVYGPDPGLAGAALLASFRECQKAGSAACSEDERQKQQAAFLTLLDAEIGCFQKLQELHQACGDQLAAAMAESMSVLPSDDLKRILRYETFLDRQFDRLLKQYRECKTLSKSKR